MGAASGIRPKLEAKARWPQALCLSEAGRDRAGEAAYLEVSVSRLRLSCLETFEPFASEYIVFHLNRIF